MVSEMNKAAPPVMRMTAKRLFALACVAAPLAKVGGRASEHYRVTATPFA